MSNIESKIRSFSDSLSKNEQSVLAAIIDSMRSSNKTVELSKFPPNEILSNEEAAYFSKVMKEHHVRKERQLNVGSRIVSIIKSTRLCNLRCTYCNAWREGPNQVMKFPVLANSIAYSLAPKDLKEVEFVWHGGEATLLKLEYYKKALWLQEQFRHTDQKVQNNIQTNGTLLTDEWVDFLIDYNISVGVSLDGPPEVNDARRLDKEGKPTSLVIKSGLQKLDEMGVKYGILMVIDDAMVAVGAKRILEYLTKELHVKKLAILNALPTNNAVGQPIQGIYLNWDNFINFQKELFLLWWEEYQDIIEIREFSSLVKTIKSKASAGVCIYAGNCMGKFITIDPNGDVTACDKYIGASDYHFGNIMQHQDLVELYASSKNLRDANTLEISATKSMNECSWYKVCNGGCPHDRRLNERYNTYYSKNCCGLTPLLELIDKKVN